MKLDNIRFVKHFFDRARRCEPCVVSTNRSARRTEQTGALYHIFVFVICAVALLSSSAFAQEDADDAAEAPPETEEEAPEPPRPPAAEGSVRLPSPTPPARGAAVRKSETPPVSGETPAPSVEGASDELVYLNVPGEDITKVIKQISKATGKNFIIDDKIKGKVTIISERKMTKDEVYQAFLSALEVAGYTVVQGPAGILKIVPHKDAASAPIPIHVDSTPYTDSFITRLVSLNNISALEMSNAVKPLISKNGNMFAYPATNTLIITDSGTNIDRLMKIIKELDQEGPQQVVEIIRIIHADAGELASTVLNLFEAESKQAAATSRRSKQEGDLSEVQDVSKIIADERTNSLIVVASKRAIAKVREIIGRLDTPLDVGDKGSIHVHYLKYANAPELAQTLASLTSGAGKPQKGGGSKEGGGDAAPSTVAKLEGGINIGADEETNALIITASSKDYKVLVDELISKLDIPRRQVYLESMIMELRMDKQKDIGLRGFSGLGIGSMLGFGQTFAATGGLSGIFSSGGMIGGVISRDSQVIDVPVISGGTVTNQQVTIPSYAAFLNLIQVYSDANIVSSPNILTLDNEEAEINIIDKIYARKTTSVATSGSVISEPTPLETGLILKLTPQINEGDVVRLKIEQELSNFTGTVDELTGAAPSTKRKVTTTVLTEDGQTVVLGGLMQDNVTNTKSKVPILGDIPILGWLFRTSASRNVKSNLLIFITPHVIHDPNDFSVVMKRKIEERNRFVDENFGSKQQREIRKMIAMHRADLVEFVPPERRSAPAPVPYAPPPQVISPEAPLPPPATAVPPSGKQPVITVPSVDPRQSSAPQRPNAPVSPQTPVTPPPPPPGAGGTQAPVDIDNAY